MPDASTDRADATGSPESPSEGRPEALPPLVLLPGMQCTEELFAPFVAALLGHRPGARVSVRPVTEATHVRAVGAAVAGFDRPVILVGHSLGGTVALAAARLRPDRVAGVVTLCANPRAPRADQIQAWQVRRARVTGPEPGADAGPPIELLIGPARDAASPSRHLGAARLCHRMADATGAARLGRQLTLQLERVDERPGLARFTGPVLAVGAEDDLLVPPERSREIAAAAPRGAVRILPRATHMAPLLAPDLVAATVTTWLEREFGQPGESPTARHACRT
ncbi:alpha/beta fold hydrolase [Streptomyces sp. AD55]|uniref:alpha/beta fold hydrolase n=1 Tax=Streptomyces sp. AD55 TaxID=3242895 RepID=UPI003527C220